jgi:predicted alpha/beta-hydrolase family hydrolase
MLYVQGTRDALADPALLTNVLRDLPTATVHWLADADHGFRVPRRTGRTDEQVRAEVVAATAGWLRDHTD